MTQLSNVLITDNSTIKTNYRSSKHPIIVSFLRQIYGLSVTPGKIRCEKSRNRFCEKTMSRSRQSQIFKIKIQEKPDCSYLRHFFLSGNVFQERIFFRFELWSIVLCMFVTITGPLLATGSRILKKGYLASIIFGHFIMVSTRNFGTIPLYNDRHL